MRLKVAKNEKVYFFSVFRSTFSTNQMKCAMVPLYYENMAIYLWKYEKNSMNSRIFLFHLADLPICGY